VGGLYLESGSWAIIMSTRGSAMGRKCQTIPNFARGFYTWNPDHGRSLCPPGDQP
jgi:hypothetical protein